jgi:zinc/manganese transport system permease protein
MVETLPWWVLPSAAALILVATHTYLGLHVISRNVFFVDLALAQVAALGSTVAYLYGFELSDPPTYYVSLLFATFGAWFFSVARVPDNRVPQEAIIGLAFAVASAGAILLSAENPHGAEHLRDMMTGSILVVSAEEVRHAAVLYGAIGVFHWVFRRQFLRISMDREGAAAAGMRVQRWDFLFYLSFAIIITSSVRIAGVLLVFILLIAPAVCGAMFSTEIRARLVIGWVCGALATIGGLMMSFRMDWPPAPAISCIFACILLGSAVVGNIALARRRSWALAKVVATGLVLVGIGFGLTAFLRSELAWSWKRDEHAHDHAHEPLGVGAPEQLGQPAGPPAVSHLVLALADPAAEVKEKAAEALGRLARPEAAPALTTALARGDEDEWVNLRMAEALVRCGGARGMSALLELARAADAKVVREQALHSALAFAGRSAPTPIEGEAGEAALSELSAWWQANQAAARWDFATGRFALAR